MQQKIIVVCGKGIRSIAIAEELSDMGYKNVYNLMDGYEKYKLLNSIVLKLEIDNCSGVSIISGFASKTSNTRSNEIAL